MKYPVFLKEKGRIGVIAPSFGCTFEPYISCLDEAEDRLGKMGYTIVEGPNCRLDLGLGKSNSPEKCAEEINDFFTADRCDVIISCGGGETMCEDLPFVDFKAISQSAPKWFMGYSDNTNLVFTLPTLCDTAAVYGPNLPSFGQRPWHESIGDALSLLRGEALSVHSYDKWERESFKAELNPYVPYNCTENFNMILAGSAKGKSEVSFGGRLIGGCLDCLSLLCGTRFDKVKEFAARYKDDGIVWFMEACELSSVAVRRALWALKEAGWFENAAGFVFGRPYMIDDLSLGLSQEQAVIDVLAGLDLPIILNADIGHLPPQMPLIAGAIAEVKAENGRLTINQFLK